jgi:hypothetical protein
MIDLPAIDNTKFEKSELGERLHATLLEDMRSKNFDPFAERNSYSHDKAFQNSVKLVEADKFVRANLHGPSMQKEKFSSSYWRTWNKEKNLLEDISYDEVIKRNLDSYLSSTTRRSSIQQRSAEAKQLSASIKARTRKVRAAAKCRAVAFDAPGAYEAHSMYVGHTSKTGDNSVEFLMKACLKRDLPVNPREKNATVDPDDIGTRRAPGGALVIANRLSGAPLSTLTAKCDFPPLSTPLDPNKGASFGTQLRFKTPLKPRINPGAGDDVTLSTTERPVSTPGGLFNKAERFGTKEQKASVVVRIPVRNEGSTISSITVGHTSVDATEDHTAEEATVSNASVTQSEETIKNAVDSASSKRAARGTAATTTDMTHAEKSEPPSVVEQQFIRYEYFPNDRPGPGHYEVTLLLFQLPSPRTNGTQFVCSGAPLVRQRCHAEQSRVRRAHSEVPGGQARPSVSCFAVSVVLCECVILNCLFCRGLKCEDMANIAVFGQMCNRHEHVLYGMCLDGKCCRRSEGEKVSELRLHYHTECFNALCCFFRYVSIWCAGTTCGEWQGTPRWRATARTRTGCKRRCCTAAPCWTRCLPPSTTCSRSMQQRTTATLQRLSRLRSLRLIRTRSTRTVATQHCMPRCSSAS